MRTYVYVDGFNLYYGAVKNTPYKWLDISQLCTSLLPGKDILKIRYYTARVSGRASDPGQPRRQQVYLRALRTIPHLEIVFGTFLASEVMVLRAGTPPGVKQVIRVHKTEEKGSDVNIAAHLVRDGFRDEFDCAVVISNDSDLVEPLRIVRQELGKQVGVLNPHKNPSYHLKKVVDFVLPIPAATLSSCQFPDHMTDSKGPFHKPNTW
jgi:uncharacterized LabA/DUF88 family protein